ncbi:MAG: FAD:protein FMN transferase [Sphingobium sp.]|nr:FAD:protein FMN transferase [Sphingobium sp.]
MEISLPEGHAAAVEEAFATVAHIHRRMSFHERTSDLARMREAVPGEPVEVDADTVIVLRKAIELCRVTDGLFDVAVGRALVRGGFLPRTDIERLDRYVGATDDIEIVDECHVRCRRPVLVDLGGIAKGYAVDRAVEVLLARDVSAALINAGGDLRAFGDCDWPVELRDANGQIRFMVPVRNCALASSANLGNRRRYRGRTVSPHIGREGVSVLAEHRVSVIASTCIVADALTKVVMADRILAERVAGQFEARVLDMPAAGVPN